MDAPVVVLSANRPDHLEALLESLLRQQGADLAGRRVFLFQDGGRDRSGAPPAWSDAVSLANLDCFRRLVRDGFPNLSYWHLGRALARDRAERFVFEDLDAAAAVVLSDEMVLGRHYLATIDRLLGLALADERIGYVAAEGDARASPAEQRADPGRLIASRRPLGYGVVRRQWLRQRPYIEAYLAILRQRDVAAGDHAGTRALFREWGSAAADGSPDAAVAHACALTGALRLTTFAAFARSLRRAPAEADGFDGAALIEDDIFRLVPPSDARLADLAAAAASELFGGGAMS